MVNKKNYPNQKGFALVALCLTLPLLVYVAQSVGWLIWFRNGKEQSQHICQEYLLKAQGHLIKASQQVIALNSYAKSLSTQKKTFKRLLRLAPPQLKPPLMLQVQRVLAQQVLLKIQQKGIVTKGKLRASYEVRQLRQQLSRSLRKMASSWGQSPSSVPQMHFQNKSPQIEISHKDTAPQYAYKKRYEKKQELQFSWQMNLKQNFGKNFNLKNKKIWRHQCTTHPRKRNQKWTANLGEARFF